jgi:small subunit ribosomal protein S20
MAITKSGKKAHRQSLVKKVYNDRRINKVKEVVKAVRTNIAGKNKSVAVAELKNAYQALDKAAKRGVIKKGTAARRKSRLAKAIAKLS